jgi:hypothetical protein
MMTVDTREKIRLLSKWSIMNALVIPVSYLASLIIVLIVAGFFGIAMTEWGTHFQQTIIQLAGGTTLALGVGIFQQIKLKALTNISVHWITAIIAGFIITEIIAGIITWQLNLNRMQLRFIEFRVLPEALIFSVAGAITGLFQWFILKKYYIRSGYWILASGIGWGATILIMANVYIYPSLKEIPYLFILIEILAFLLGALIYGAITGAALVWIMKKKQG